MFDPFFTEHSEHQVEETSVLGLHSRFNLVEGGIPFLKPGLRRVNVLTCGGQEVVFALKALTRKTQVGFLLADHF